MKWCWCQVQHWLVVYRETGQFCPDLEPVITSWIDVQLARHGKDLDWEDARQELFLFVIEYLLPRFKCKVLIQRRRVFRKLNWHSWMLLAIRQEISKIRKRRGKIQRILLVDNNELDGSDGILRLIAKGMRRKREIEYDGD